MLVCVNFPTGRVSLTYKNSSKFGFLTTVDTIMLIVVLFEIFRMTRKRPIKKSLRNQSRHHRAWIFGAKKIRAPSVSERFALPVASRRSPSLTRWALIFLCVGLAKYFYFHDGDALGYSKYVLKRIIRRLLKLEFQAKSALGRTAFSTRRVPLTTLHRLASKLVTRVEALLQVRRCR